MGLASQLRRTEPVEQGSGDSSSPLGRAEIFDILSNRRRQYVLRYLTQTDRSPVPTREVIDQVAAWENDTTVEQLGSNERKCVYTALRQAHLPKLDRMNVIRFDKQEGTVTMTDAADEVVDYLEYTPNQGPDPCRLYAGLAAFVGGGTVFVLATVFPGSTILMVIGLLFTVAIFVSLYGTRVVMSRTASVDSPGELVKQIRR